jgi:ATP-binding cassette subfamily F protein 3
MFHLLREVCDESWLVTHGGVQPLDGDLDDYQRWLLEVSRAAQRGLPAPPLPSLLPVAATPTVAASPPPKPATAVPPPASRDDRQAVKLARAKLAARTRPLRSEIGQLDDRLARLAKEKAEVETLLAAPDLGAAAYSEYSRNLAHIQAETARIEDRWLELHAQLDAIGASE